MNFRQRMQQKLMTFMTGRYGTDQLNKFLLGASAVFLIVGLFFKGPLKSLFNILVLAGIGFAFFRMLSRDAFRRSNENSRYLRARYNLFAKLKMVKERWVQRRDYKFFTCPSCKAVLRVPKGRGKINIVCRKCGHSFTGKS